MAQTFLSPDRLYDRPWRSNHPFNRNLSAGRRWTMIAVFALLCSLIGGYLFVTDAKRVKRLAETELTKLVGGNVKVGSAKLSLFEGLRLEGVNIFIDEQTNDPNSTVFSSSVFLVSYDLPSLIAGRLKLTQIVAVDPRVQLIENLDTARWNYQRMKRQKSPTSNPAFAGKLPPLPEIILRNAQIDYSEIRNGKQSPKGTMNIEGQFAPTSNGQKYTFELQSRGAAGTDNSAAVGPTVQGTLDRSGEVKATLKDFQFGKDIRSMLPAVVRDWWDQHQLAGAVDIPRFVYRADPEGEAEPRFEVQTQFKGVKLTVQPAEWMSRDEVQIHAWAGSAFEALRDVGLNGNGFVDALSGLVQPSPLELTQAQGMFTFTNDGIIVGERDPSTGNVKPITGVVEENTFAIQGNINGYSPLSPATIFINTEKTQIPAQPRYITSMPRQIREFYEHLRPQGTCQLHVKLDRRDFGGRLDFSGSVAIIEGNFLFDKFPYPVHGAKGTIVFGYEPRTDMDQVRLIDLVGHGVPGGPNEKANIKLSGVIGPLNNDVGVSVTVAGENVHDEPALRAAFPEEVRQALRNLDADGKGEYPKFRGAFECRINRAIGPVSIWNIDTDVTLDDAAGKMVAFPYFMEHVTGKLAIREGYVDIIGATMKKPNNASLTIEGRVTWRAGVGGRPLEPGEIAGHVTPSRPDLKITARNVPIDKALLDALPRERRDWIEKVGLTGTLDIDGHVWRPTPGGAEPVPRSESGSELTHAFDIALKHGTIWPIEGTFAISDLNGTMRLLPDRMVINSMTAKRGKADLVARGEIAWPDNKPSVFMSGAASKLELDRTLYRFLPAPAQAVWNAVKPEGVVDLDLSYKGSVAEEDRVSGVGVRVSGKDATTQSSSPETRDPKPETRSTPLQNLDLIIHPVKLSATVQAVPYRLDDITGTVRLSNGKVQLTDLVGKHGDGTIRLSGSGPADRTDWDLHIAAEKIKVDDAFRKALPGGLASLVDTLKLTGTVGFEFSKLEIRDTPPDLIPKVRPATTAPVSDPLDLDFAVKLNLADAAIDVGMPMTHIDGKMELTGSVRGSKLAGLSGPMDLATLKIADRSARDLHCEFYKPADKDGLRIGDITGSMCGGEIAGNVDLTFPEIGDSRYDIKLVLRNADVREMSGLKDENLSGDLSVSMDLEGGWADPRTRRGRGDVSVSGKEMYKIPLVLGLLQITNLSLPINAPFTNGQAFYSVAGQAVTFERLELRSQDMVMSGSGKLDFATRKVNMSFTTDNPNWPKVPIIGDLAQAAKHELLQIHVKGTLEDPKVSASAVNTVSTTIDEVFRGDGKK